MEHLRLLYEQIEEGKRLLLSGTLSRLRLALILLDNAAELIMYRELSYRFAADDYFSRIRDTRKYTDEERRAAEQEFKPMVKILSLKLGMIPAKQAMVLRVCHGIRRDAFHRGETNPAILLPVVRLLFNTVCELARAFPVHSYSIASGIPRGENAEFLVRFGLNPYELGDEKGREKIYHKLMEGIAFDTSLPETLSRDLEERIDRTIEGLSYLNNDSSDRDKLDHNLRHTQFWRERGAEIARKADEEGRAPKHDLDNAYREWSENPGPRFTMGKLERWHKQASAITRAKSPADALAKYRAIEHQLAPLEEDIIKAVVEFDEHIDMLVKERRYSR